MCAHPSFFLPSCRLATYLSARASAAGFLRGRIRAGFLRGRIRAGSARPPARPPMRACVRAVRARAEMALCAGAQVEGEGARTKDTGAEVDDAGSFYHYRLLTWLPFVILIATIEVLY